MRFNIGNDITDGGHFNRVFVRDGDAAFFLQIHHQLDDVQGIRVQVVLDRGLGGQRGRIRVKLIGEQGTDFFKLSGNSLLKFDSLIYENPLSPVFSAKTPILRNF